MLRTLVIASALFVTACAGRHAAMHGQVVMKINSTEAHVCLASGEVAVNDRVELYKQVCTNAGKRAVCTDRVIGEGTVVQLLDDHYSVVDFPAGTQFEEGYRVTKLVRP